MRHLVLNDGYTAFCSSIPFDAEIRAGGMRAIRGDWRFPPFATRLFRRRASLVTPALERFIDEVKRAAQSTVAR